MTVNHRAAKDANDALNVIFNGGRAFVSTQTRLTIIDRKTVDRFAKANEWILKDDADGKGIRLRRGRGSVYLFAGQLRVTMD